MVLLVAGAIVMGALALASTSAPAPSSAPPMGFWEAAARGFVSVVMVNETFDENGHSVTLPAGIRVTNTASVPVVIPEEAVLMSPHPSQSPPPDPMNTTADAALTNATVPAQGSLLYLAGRLVLAGYLHGPMWWDLEEMQSWKAGVEFRVGGETLPFGLRALVEHPFYHAWEDNTQTALWASLRSYPWVVVGKQPLWASTMGSPGATERVRIDATNMAVWATDDAFTANVNVTRGIVEDDVPAGWNVEWGAFSVPPDINVSHADGSRTLGWNEDLPGAPVSGESNPALPTDFTTVTRFYTLVAPGLYNGSVTLPRALSDMNRTGTPDAHSAPVVILGNMAPEADAGGPYVGKEGETIVLDASKSSDPDGDPLQFRWSYTDNGTWDTAWSAVPTASVTYTDEFSGHVRVEVTDGHTMANATAPVTIANVPPAIESLTFSENVSARFRLTMAGEKWHDARFVLQADGGTLADLRVVRDPGDPAGQSQSTPTVTVDLARPVVAWVLYTPGDDPVNGQPKGDSPAWLTVTFPNGSAVRLFHNFNVAQPETWNWSLDALRTVFPRGSVTLQAHLFDPGADALTAHWDFGDGTNATQFFPNGPAGDTPESPVGGAAPMDVAATLLHAYAVAGSYTVTLTVTDGDGASSTASLNLQIA